MKPHEETGVTVARIGGARLHPNEHGGGRRSVHVATRFNEEIVKPQCLMCNVFLRGNYGKYTLKMLDLHGREKVEEFMALKHQVVKYTRTDLEELIESYKQKLKELA